MRLVQVDLTGADLTEASLYRADLSDASLIETLFICTDLNEAVIGPIEGHEAGASMRRAQFLSADLRHADLRGADLTGAVFDSAARDGHPYEFADPTDLRGADLTGTRHIEEAQFGLIVYDDETKWPVTEAGTTFVPPPSVPRPAERSGEQCGPLQFAS